MLQADKRETNAAAIILFWRRSWSELATLSKNDNQVVLERHNLYMLHDVPALLAGGCLCWISKLHLLLYVDVHRDHICCF